MIFHCFLVKKIIISCIVQFHVAHYINLNFVKYLIHILGVILDKGLWITADMVPSVLYFLAKVSSEPLMKDWLGGHEGNIFWPSLLTMLCNTPIQSATVPASVPREGVSDNKVAAIRTL